MNKFFKKVIVIVVATMQLVLIQNGPAQAEDFGYDNEYKREGSFIFIAIDSNPTGAVVKIDGKVDTAGTQYHCFIIDNVQSTSEKHTISMELPGYEKWEDTIDISKKEIATFFNTNREPGNTNACSPQTAKSTINYDIINLKKSTASKPTGNETGSCSGKVGLMANNSVDAVPELAAEVKMFENKAAKVTLTWAPPQKTPKGDIEKYSIMRGNDTNGQGNTINNMSAVGSTKNDVFTFTDEIEGTEVVGYKIAPVRSSTANSSYNATDSNVLLIDFSKAGSCTVTAYETHNMTASDGENQCGPLGFTALIGLGFTKVILAAFCNLGLMLHDLVVSFLTWVTSQFTSVVGIRDY